MNAKNAVKEAKAYVQELFAEEGIMNLGLEEIEFDDDDASWNVTLGFSRPWNSVRTAVSAITGEAAVKRAYRVVKLRDNDGQVVSVLRRDALD